MKPTIARCIATLLAGLLAAGCGVPSAPSASAPTVAPAMPVSAPTAAPAPAQQSPGDRLFIYDGSKGDAERLVVVDSRSGAREHELPPGITSPDWQTLYATEQSDGKTTVRAVDIASGETLRQIALDGASILVTQTDGRGLFRCGQDRSGIRRGMATAGRGTGGWRRRAAGTRSGRWARAPDTRLRLAPRPRILGAPAARCRTCRIASAGRVPRALAVTPSARRCRFRCR